MGSIDQLIGAPLLIDGDICQEQQNDLVTVRRIKPNVSGMLQYHVVPTITYTATYGVTCEHPTLLPIPYVSSVRRVVGVLLRLSLIMSNDMKGIPICFMIHLTCNHYVNHVMIVRHGKRQGVLNNSTLLKRLTMGFC